jgi:hypothetical protein
MANPLADDSWLLVDVDERVLEGEGIVVQPWVINVAPGRMKWTVVDSS